MGKPLEQAEPLPFALNIVKPGLTQGEVPESERIDKERTLEVRKALTKDGNLPRLVRSVHEQFSTGGIHIPDPDETKVFGEQARTDTHWRICGECVRFDYQAGQEFLSRGGAWSIIESLGGQKEASWLGDWRKYGWCEPRGCPCDFHGPKCEFFEEKRRGVFGRILSGTWKRIRDI